MILNSKGYKDTIECLESVLKLDYKHYKIVVVDNSPDMYDFEQLRSWAQNGSVKISSSFPDLVYPCVEKPLKIASLNEGDFSIDVDFFILMSFKQRINLIFLTIPLVLYDFYKRIKWIKE